MITDAPADAVFEEAEAIVRAEWMRVQRDNAPRERGRCAVPGEMPAAGSTSDRSPW